MRNIFYRKSPRINKNIDTNYARSGLSALFERVEADPELGLTDEQVRLRREAGAVNIPPKGVTPALSLIIYRNVFTLFNCINLILAVLIVLVGNSRNAIFFFVAVCNTFMGIIQEIRAKRTLDRLTILSEGSVKAIRGGRETLLPQRDIVLDDIFIISAGEQVYADAIVLVSNGLEVNESLLTGESENVTKQSGQILLSGSYIAAGSAYARATAVGAASYANTLAVRAKHAKKEQTPMMRSINRIIRILTYIIIPLGALLFLTRWRAGIPNAVLSAAAAMIGMIPEGLVLLTGAALTIGALRLARASALVQTLPGIEMLARADIMCLDKTGTITDGKLLLFDIIPISGCDKADAVAALREMIGALSEENTVSAALMASIGQSNEWPVDFRVPFSSERKWSGVCFSEKGCYILGAPAAVIPDGIVAHREFIESLTGAGKRVLCLARADKSMNGAKLPDGLAAEALIVLSDVLRPEAAATFKFFAEEGVGLKIISGDDPLTVSSIAGEAGIQGYASYIDMGKVAEPVFDPGDESRDRVYSEIAAHYTVFGRTSPAQKKALVSALRRDGHTVCMTGDGVNDVLAMKEADCSVAMRSGSGAARGASDFVLMSSDFSSMKQILYEGRRVINNIETVSALYLIKTIYSTALSVLYLFISAPYPFEPVQVTPINMFTVGIPSFFLALRNNFAKPEGRFGANILHYSLPAALVIVINIMIIHIYGMFFDLLPAERGLMRIVATGVTGFYALLMLTRPYGKWLALFFSYVAVFSVCLMLLMPFFNLNALEPRDILLLIPLLVCIPVFFTLIRRLTPHFQKIIGRIK